MFEEGSSYSGDIDWNDVIKKEARGINNEDLGEVQEVTPDYVLVEKGVINKEKFYIPRDLAAGYNGSILIFNLTAEEAKNKFLSDSPPVLTQLQSSGQGATINSDLVIVPIMAERLGVSKKMHIQEAKIIKESITETKTSEVPLVHDELYIETRPISKDKQEKVGKAKGYLTNRSQVQSSIPREEEVATLFLKMEVVEVSKHPYLKEEVIVKKEPIRETKKITEQLRSENVNVEGIEEEEIMKKEEEEYVDDTDRST